MKIENLYLTEINEKGEQVYNTRIGDGIDEALKLSGNKSYNKVTLILQIETDNGLIVVASDLIDKKEGKNCTNCGINDVCPIKSNENEHKKSDEKYH